MTKIDITNNQSIISHCLIQTNNNKKIQKLEDDYYNVYSNNQPSKLQQEVIINKIKKETCFFLDFWSEIDRK